MLRALLVLLTVGLCLAKINYQTTKKVISENDKDSIMAADDDDAFDSFLNLYDDIEPEGFRGSTSPEEQKKEKAKMKTIFVGNIKTIREHNKRYDRGEESYKMVVNSFAVMDDANRRMYLGAGRDSIDPSPALGMGFSSYQSGLFNASVALGVPLSVPLSGGRRGLGSARAASSIDWRNKLGPIKNQGTCGSCWTYPTTALLEFAIEKTTGQKIPLSEQQLLDCTYESQNYNACKGGWYYQAWDYIIQNGNKLASEADYQYKNADGACYASYYSNAMAGKIKLNSYKKIPASEVLDKMNISPLAVAFFVENRFYSIGSGVFDGCYTYYQSNHAVTLTGYGNGYWEIRNSWGGDWGRNGYGKFKRSGVRSICNLLSAAYAISYSSTDGGDGGDDREEERETDSDCDDNAQYAENCASWATSGYCDSGEYVEWMKDNCQKSCGSCKEKEREEEQEDRSDCSDTRSESECQDWENSYSYCTTGEYVEWMATNCAKTCGKCGDEERREETEEPEEKEEECGCEDSDQESCPSWKDSGYCAKTNEYHEWMSENCAKSCGTCDCDEEERERETGECENSHEKCKKWEKLDYCNNDEYRDYMRTNCQKSCDSCREATEATEEATEATEATAQLIPHSEVSQSSVQKVKKLNMEPSRAVDGDDSTKSQTKCSGKKDAWFKYVFVEAARVSTVEIVNGNLDKKRAKLDGASVYVHEVEGLKKKCGDIVVSDSSSKTEQTYSVDCQGAFASGIEIVQTVKYKKKKCLELAEVKVYGFPGQDSTASSSSSEPTEEATEGERESGDDCPGGTTRCPDGICKHVHMCSRSG